MSYLSTYKESNTNTKYNNTSPLVLHVEIAILKVFFVLQLFNIVVELLLLSLYGRKFCIKSMKEKNASCESREVFVQFTLFASSMVQESFSPFSINLQWFYTSIFIFMLVSSISFQ